MEKQKYFSIRNLAWELLLSCKIKELPVDLHSIARKKGWYIVKEDEWIRQIESEIELHHVDTNFFIIHKETANAQRLRFSIAHEFGHILLEHLELSEAEKEREANMFASRLLMPLIVLDKLGVTTAEQIADLCDVSLEAATYRFARLKEIRSRQKFMSHELERKVLENFKEFIVR